MAVSYKKLFHMLIDRNISNTLVKKRAKYCANITTRLKNNTYASLDSEENTCLVLNCKVNDIVELIPDEDLMVEN